MYFGVIKVIPIILYYFILNFVFVTNISLWNMITQRQQFVALTYFSLRSLNLQSDETSLFNSFNAEKENCTINAQTSLFKVIPVTPHYMILNFFVCN